MKLNDCSLYGILDLGYLGSNDPILKAEQMLKGGVEILQLRAKGKQPSQLLSLSCELNQLCRKWNRLYIVNDFIQLARDSNAHGLHIGQEDGNLKEIRQQLLPHQIIGRSTHSLEQARVAEKEGADYIGIGPIFATPTKPDYIPVGLSLIQDVLSEIKIPGFCIGGIKIENLDHVLEAGATRVVIVSGILQAEDPIDYCQKVVYRLRNFS